jgi:hypothetical protein
MCVPKGCVSVTCRIYMAGERGIIRNDMYDLAQGRADGLVAVGCSLREQVYPTVSGTASQSEVGVGRGLGV